MTEEPEEMLKVHGRYQDCLSLSALLVLQVKHCKERKSAPRPHHVSHTVLGCCSHTRFPYLPEPP